jgi:hypothetical protein
VDVSANENTAIDATAHKVRVDARDLVTLVTAQLPKNPDASLGALPTELQHGIFGYLSRRPLFRLSLVNKELNAVAVPILYGKGITAGMRECRCRSLIHIISMHPKLAKMVKVIDVV